MVNSEFWQLLKERFQDLKFTGKFVAKWHMIKGEETSISWDLDGDFTDEIHTRFLELFDLGGRELSGSAIGFGLNALRRESGFRDFQATAVMLPDGEFEHHEGGTVVNPIWASVNPSDILQRAKRSEELLARAPKREVIREKAAPVPNNVPSIGVNSVETIKQEPEIVGNQIEVLRTECDITIEELAEKIEIDPTNVSRHIRGLSTSTRKNRQAYEKFFSKQLQRKILLIRTQPKRR